ncbi:MAG TPA: OPT/YSL family transporter [Myxococcales bacterium]|nr:OPT/YSL family transporter [Myxococcales bacterium]
MSPDARPAPELTPRALASGLTVGALLCVANLYMGLKTGFWDSGHVTASVLAFALASGKLTRLENNTAQTAATAAGAVPAAAGLLGAIPALDLLGRSVPAWGIGLWGLALAVLGIGFAAALRRRLLEEEKLPFPTGVATAEVIEVLHGGARAAREHTRPLLQGGLAGLLLGWFRDGRPALLPAVLPVPGALWGVSMATLGIGVSTSPLLWGVGMVVGARVALSMLLGSALAWGVLAPWLVRGPLHVAGARGAIWGWLSWPGTALLVGAAVVALVQQAGSVTGALGDLRSAGSGRPGARLRRLLPGVAAAVAIVVLGHVVFRLPAPLTALALLLSVVGASVCARAAGLTDISPLGPIGQATQAAVGGLAPGQAALNVAAGSVVAGGATQTGILLWSLGAGRALRATPRSQVAAAVAGSTLGAIICAPAYALFVRAYGLGSPRLPVPTGIQWKAMGEVVARGLSALPPGALPAVIAAGATGIALAALGSSRAGRWFPSAMAMGIGVLVPVDYSLSFVLGAFLVRGVRGLRGRGPVIGAGLIAGDSLVGVTVALLTALGVL